MGCTIILKFSVKPVSEIGHISMQASVGNHYNWFCSSPFLPGPIFRCCAISRPHEPMTLYSTSHLCMHNFLFLMSAFPFAPLCCSHPILVFQLAVNLTQASNTYRAQLPELPTESFSHTLKGPAAVGGLEKAQL
uniref:Uncharacterized protein n=1 Tax=Ixodes ricinus TaxID=34613 RepID=A0A0K8R5J4_IXORI